MDYVFALERSMFGEEHLTTFKPGLHATDGTTGYYITHVEVSGDTRAKCREKTEEGRTYTTSQIGSGR
jgi:hypothetical protein